MDTLASTIYDLEKSLGTSAVRQSASAVAARLSEDFTEFCSSGKVYRYEKGDTFDGGDAPDVYEIAQLEVKMLGANGVLATYRATRTADGARSLRSSVWQMQNGVWKMVFHQGTPVNE